MLRPALLALTFLAIPAQAMERALPATLSVEVVSLREGKPWRKTVAKVRLGDRVLLRDETDVPYVTGVDRRGVSATAKLTSGLVATVTPVLRQGRLRLEFVSTVRAVTGFDTARVPVPGQPDAVISQPIVAERTFEAAYEPPPSGGAWQATQSLADLGFGVSATARPLATP